MSKRYARVPVVLGLAVLPLAMATNAEAYVAADIHARKWSGSSVAWRFTGEVPAAFRAGVRAGAAAWNGIANFTFTETAGDAANFNASTGTCSATANTIHFENIPLNEEGNVVLAHTPSCYSGNTMSRFSIVINSDTSMVTWYTGTDTPPAGQHDLISVMAHEFGHATGYNGPDNDGHFLNGDTECTGTYTRHTMCESTGSGDRRGRTLEQQDVRILNEVYPGSNAACGYVVYGAIRTKWNALGGTSGLGCPSAEEYDVRELAREQLFATGTIVNHPSLGVFAVKNGNNTAWRSFGATDWGFPVMDEAGLPDGIGAHNHFRDFSKPTTCGQQNNRSIYWSPQTGSHAVQDDIRAKWCALGWEGGMGYPATDQNITPDGYGRYNHFRLLSQGTTCSTNGNRSIYWRPETGAHAVMGGIRQRWCALGWEGGVVGYPTTDENPTPTRTGAYTHFRKFSGTTAQYDASIYWSPTTGSWEVYDKIRTKWASLGWEQGLLGFPTNTVTAVASGKYQPFEYGRLYSKFGPGEHEVHGPILSRYNSEGGPGGSLGFPTTDVYAPAVGFAGDQQVDFEFGTIRYVASNGSTILCPVAACTTVL